MAEYNSIFVGRKLPKKQITFSVDTLYIYFIFMMDDGLMGFFFFFFVDNKCVVKYRIVPFVSSLLFFSLVDSFAYIYYHMPFHLYTIASYFIRTLDWRTEHDSLIKSYRVSFTWYSWLPLIPCRLREWGEKNVNCMAVRSHRIASSTSCRLSPSHCLDLEHMVLFSIRKTIRRNISTRG